LRRAFVAAAALVGPQCGRVDARLLPHDYARTMTADPEGPVGAATYRIITVCLGNICRSPMAEAVLRRKIGEAGLSHAVSVESAGTAGWHQGSDADPRARATLQRHGYPLRHSARQFQRSWFDAMDLILAMDRSNLDDLRGMAARSGASTHHVHLLRSFDPAARGEEVPDPYYGGPEGFVEVLRMVESASDGVVTHVRASLRTRS
jgi:protein-tyrosine phosphatase